jgi:prevent-host-death family protein
MIVLSATKARNQFHALIDQASTSHEPIQIFGKRHNAVLVGEDDWRSIQETLHLLSIPGMRKAIREGLKSPMARCAKSLK